MLTLSDGTTTITLPDSIEWVDEYDWNKVLQDIRPTIGLSLVIHENEVTDGRPITLETGSEVWVKKSVIDALYALVNVANKVFTLTLPDTRTFQVMFNRESKPFDAKPIFRQIIQDADADYTLTLRLMEI